MLRLRLRGVLPGVMALTNRSGWSYDRTGVAFKTPRNVTLLPSGLNTGVPMVPSMLLSQYTQWESTATPSASFRPVMKSRSAPLPSRFARPIVADPAEIVPLLAQ